MSRPTSSLPKHYIVAASAWVSRVVTTLVSLYSVRLLTEGLGVQHYAIYAVLVGITTWFMLTDVGMGMSMQNFISEARANDHTYDEYIAITCLFVALVTAVFAGLIYFLGPLIADVVLKQFGFLSTAEKHFDFVITAIISLGICFGSLVYRVWYAEQKGYYANVLPAMAALAGLACIYWVSKSNSPDKLLWYLIGGNIWFALFPTAALITKLGRIWQDKPQIALSVLLPLFRRAWQFWLFTLVAALVLQVDYIFLAQFVRPEEIVIYVVTMKLYALAAFLYSAVLQAFWPTCAEWVVAKKWNRIRDFTIKYIVFALSLIIIFTALVVLFRVELLRFFMPSAEVTLPIGFILLVGSAFVVRAWTDVFAIILQSMNDMGQLLLWATIQAAINISLQLLLAPQLGIYGVILGLMISFILTVTWALPTRVYILRLSFRLPA